VAAFMQLINRGKLPAIISGVCEITVGNNQAFKYVLPRFLCSGIEFKGS
jgi:hypothetical protein